MQLRTSSALALGESSPVSVSRTSEYSTPVLNCSCLRSVSWIAWVALTVMFFGSSFATTLEHRRGHHDVSPRSSVFTRLLACSPADFDLFLLGLVDLRFRVPLRTECLCWIQERGQHRSAPDVDRPPHRRGASHDPHNCCLSDLPPLPLPPPARSNRNGAPSSVLSGTLLFCHSGFSVPRFLSSGYLVPTPF